jgi:hypothetical protein
MFYSSSFPLFFFFLSKEVKKKELETWNINFEFFAEGDSHFLHIVSHFPDD